MLRTTLFATFILISLSTIAQNDPCLDLLLKQPGTWKQSKNPESTAPADLAVEKKSTTAIHDMIRSRFNPVALEANYGVGFVKDPYRPYDSWFYSLLALQFTCDNGKIGKNHEGSSSLRIDFNQFGFGEIHDTTDDAQGLGYHTLQHGLPVEEKPGLWHFPVDRAGLGFGRFGKSDLWLFTYDGKLPWSYVTRREFLTKRKRNLYILMERSRTSTKETIAGIEKQKPLMEEQYKNDPAKLDKYMRLDYKPMMERYQKILADNDKPYLAAIAVIDEQLNRSASILDQKTIVKQDPHSSLGYLFCDATDPMAAIPIQPNPGYFKKASRHYTHLITVETIWDHEDPISVKFHEDLSKALDLDRIRKFIGGPSEQP